MMRIAITGGIGAGKSYVCNLMRLRGIEIYDCDSGAKRLMAESLSLRQALTSLIGPDTYVDGKLNKAVVAAYLLASEENKQAINSIVHPAVIKDFYNSGVQWMESAILYEAHLEDSVDKVVCVSAPENVRIERIMVRDSISEQKSREWIARQMNQEEVANRADVVIVNDGIQSLDEQITQMLEYLGIKN